MRDSQRRNQPAVNPDAPLHHNARTAMQQDEKRKQQRIAENNQTYAEIQLQSREERMLRAWDYFMEKLHDSRKEK
jgi:hypothetical protein